MKKLLIVTDAWSPQVNGVVTVFEKMLPLLREKGFEVTVVHPGLFKTVPFFLYPEIPLAPFPRSRMEAIFDAEKPTYVHIATEWMLGITARALCVERGIPFTTSFHTNFNRYVSYYLNMTQENSAAFAYGYMRWFHNASAVTMVSTPTLQTELQANGFKKVVVWPLGIDTNFFTRNGNYASEEMKCPIFVYCGRVAKEKNIEEFLRLKLPGTKLVIGDGPERKKLQKRYGHETRFVGYKRGQELVDWLSACDVCVFPSLTETFGLAMVEALACGIPVAAHNVMGPKDIITNGVDGFLDEDLGRAALRCLDLSKEKCREKALMFSKEHSADMFIQTIEEVAQMTKGSAPIPVADAFEDESWARQAEALLERPVSFLKKLTKSRLKK
ncbi:MAG: glycosyltransferase family 1 protein [Patescibacteria group bacterium]